MPQTFSKAATFPQTKILNAFLDLIFPPICKVCGRASGWLCGFCSSALRFNPLQLCADCRRPSANGVTHAACRKRYGLDGVLVAGLFPQLQELVHAYKYQNHKNLSADLSELLARFLDGFAYLEYFSSFELVPMPLHKKRLRFRGFNQSELLAEQLSRRIPLILQKGLLVRIRDTETQTRLNREERLLNLKEAFAVSDQEIAKNKRFLLIDDITTTGSTLAECGRTLKKAGAETVWALVLARG